MFQAEVLPAIINGILTGSVYGLIAVGLSLCFGLMGILNFAHGSIVMLGMYATYYFYTLSGVNVYWAILLVVPLFFIFGVILHGGLFRFMLDAPHNNQILVSIGLLIFVNNLAMMIFSPNVRTLQISFLGQGISFGESILSFSRLLAFAMALVMFSSLILFLKFSHTGKALRACSQNRDGAKICGIDVPKIYSLSFAITAAFAGLAGLLILPFSGVYPEIGDTFILTAFIIIVLGGMGRIGGTFWAAVLIGVAEALGATFMTSSLKYLVPFLIFIIVLLFRPAGLFVKAS